jgi:hypothetical protein
MLKKGWNMLSFPFEISSSLLKGELFATTPEDCVTKIATYNTTKKLFKTMNNSKWSNMALDEGQGYWIYANGTCTLTLEGNSKSTTHVTVEKGWNLIAFHAESKKNRTHVIQNVRAKLKKIMSYHGGNWYSYDPTRPEVLNTIKEFHPGWGYYIQYNGSGSERWELDENKQLKVIGGRDDR